MCPANKIQCYTVTPSLIGWAHTGNHMYLRHQSDWQQADNVQRSYTPLKQLVKQTPEADFALLVKQVGEVNFDIVMWWFALSDPRWCWHQTQISCYFYISGRQLLNTPYQLLLFHQSKAAFQQQTTLTHLPLVSHICVSESGQHRFR